MKEAIPEVKSIPGGERMLATLLSEAVSRLGGRMEVNLDDLPNGSIEVEGNYGRITVVVKGMGNA